MSSRNGEVGSSSQDSLSISDPDEDRMSTTEQHVEKNAENSSDDLSDDSSSSGDSGMTSSSDEAEGRKRYKADDESDEEDALSGGTKVQKLVKGFMKVATTAIRAECDLQQLRELRSKVQGKPSEMFCCMEMEYEDLCEKESELLTTVNQWRKILRKQYEEDFISKMRPTVVKFKPEFLPPYGDWINAPIPPLPMGRVGEGWDAARIDETLARRVDAWIKDPAGMAGDFAYASRNEALFRIIMYAAGVSDYEFLRTVGEANAPDFALMKHDIPILFASESVDDFDKAKKSVAAHVHFTPHLSWIPFFITMVITRDELSVDLIERKPDSDGLIGSNAKTESRNVYHGSFFGQYGREKAVPIAINIGRVLQYWIKHKLIITSSNNYCPPMFRWGASEIGGNDKNCFPTLRGMFVKYSLDDRKCEMKRIHGFKQGKELLDYHVQFYQDCREVSYLERMVSQDGPVLHLVPFGLAAGPRNLSELCDALKCVTTAVYGMHDKGYLHTKIEWKRIVQFDPRSWYLMDCHDVCSISDTKQCEGMLKYRRNPREKSDATRWGKEHDAQQVAKLLTEYANKSWFKAKQAEMDTLKTQIHTLAPLADIHKTLDIIRPNQA